MNQINLIVVMGTRPEAIKLSPLLFALHKRGDCNFQVFFTGQHTDLIRQVINDLGMSDILGPALTTLPSGSPDAHWAELAKERLGNLLAEQKSNVIVVLGDTSSARLGAEVATEAGVTVCHVEAGLRLAKIDLPEEKHRRKITKLASIHCVPSQKEKHNLIAEGIDGNAIIVIGDLSALYRQFAFARASSAVRSASNIEDALNAAGEGVLASLIGTKVDYVLCTFHRLTSLEHWSQLAIWLNSISQHIRPRRLILCSRPDSRWQPFYTEVSETNSALILSAARPLVFQILLRYACCVVTDSAGVQQEAILSGKRVIVMREEVELYKNHPLLQLVPPPFEFDWASVAEQLLDTYHWIQPDLDWEKSAGPIVDKLVQAIAVRASAG